MVVKVIRFKCELCGKEFDTREEAENCGIICPSYFSKPLEVE